MRFRDLIAMFVSVIWLSISRLRSFAPITVLQRPIWVSVCHVILTLSVIAAI